MRAPWDRPTRLSGNGIRLDGGGGGNQEIRNEPWGGLQPYLTSGYQAAERDILRRPTEFFPESTVVPFAPESQAALAAGLGRAVYGSPLLGASQEYTHELLTDPLSTPIGEAVVSSVRPGVDTAFASGRRYGSPLHAEAMGRGVSRGLAPFMESAAQRAPGLAREDYYDIGQLRGIGAKREAKAQQELTDQITRYEYGQQEPTARTTQYMNVLSGFPSVGGTQRTSGGGGINPWLAAPGLALSAAGTAGDLGWQPFVK